MPSLDLAMPLALLIVVTVAMLLNKRVEGKLMATVEEKEFKIRDIILLIVFMAIVISVIAYTSILRSRTSLPKYSARNIPVILHHAAVHVLLRVLKPDQNKSTANFSWVSALVSCSCWVSESFRSTLTTASLFTGQ